MEYAVWVSSRQKDRQFDQFSLIAEHQWEKTFRLLFSFSCEDAAPGL
jgi:hypothetical protein